MGKIKWLFSKPWFYCLLFIFCIDVAYCSHLVILSITTPKIEFSSSAAVELKSAYNKDYTVKYLGEDISKDVIVTGSVDTSKVGDYTLTYIITVDGHKYIKHRIVKVVDTTPPVITLTGNATATVCPNAKYVEEGYTAIDNYDGDISKNVTTTITDNEITYSVKDSSGNETTIKREITYKDDVAPTITLKGNSSIYTYLNQSYKDAGYTATDNCDGDITKNVKVDGTVNTASLGIYKITYSIADAIGLSYSITRTVNVVNRPNNGGKTIYLTFDDGPSNVTSSILDILKEENVKATFFVINRPAEYNDLIVRENNEGHTVALHSYTHNYSVIYVSDAAFFNDLSLINEKVKGLIGIEPKVMRFPGGSSNTVSRHYSTGIMSRLVQEVADRGYVYFDWNVSSTDTQNIGADQVYQNVISQLSSGNTSIVLMHDYASNWQSVNALKRIIDYGKQMGYSFDRITTSTPQIKQRVAN